jgi:hypothetical protein
MKDTWQNVGRSLLVLGLLVVVGSTGYWLAAGANTGWTKTYVEIEKVDDITGIHYAEKKDQFVPGVDLLAPAAAAGFICIFAGVVIVRRSKPNKP